MADLLPAIPLELMNPARKYGLMNWLVGLGLPNRISRQVLQQWGESMDVAISAGDYDLLNNHLLTQSAGKFR